MGGITTAGGGLDTDGARLALTFGAATSYIEKNPIRTEAAKATIPSVLVIAVSARDFSAKIAAKGTSVVVGRRIGTPA